MKKCIITRFLIISSLFLVDMMPAGLKVLPAGNYLFSVAPGSFEMPAGDRRYDHVCWLASHNAYAAEHYGYIYANQTYTFSEQLEHGVRQFELDIEKRCWDKTLGVLGSSGCTVSMCHGSCEVNKFIQPKVSGILEKTGDPLGMKTSALVVFKDFLNKYPGEIITITIENRVTEPGLLDKQFEDAGVQDMVLKPTDWNPIQQKGWPTLDWLRKNNKRLIVFNDKEAAGQRFNTSLPFAATKYTYFQWACFAQNQWAGASAKRLEDVAMLERKASENQGQITKYLFELDYFADGAKIIGTVPTDLIVKIAGALGKQTPFRGDYRVVNNAELRKLLEMVLARGLSTGIAKGRYPNFIKVDYIEEGNPLALVNEINAKANDPAVREIMFRPIFSPEREREYNAAIAGGMKPIDALKMMRDKYKV